MSQRGSKAIAEDGRAPDVSPVNVPSEAAIKRAVRQRYSQVAEGGLAAGESCGSSATGASGECCGSSASGGDVGLLDLGCGNPLPFASIEPGNTVLDLGSGSGAEVLRAARMVGPEGKAIGVDMTDAMLELARANQQASGIANAEFLKGEIESLPLPDATVDVIVSNCVLNLSPDKASALAEAFRVLRPGGRFVVADVVVEGAAEPDAAWRADLAGWSACVTGAMTEAGYARALESAGFIEIQLARISSYTEGSCCGAGAGVPLVSDLISARKPVS